MKPINRREWRMASKHGYRRDLLVSAFDTWWARVWLCRIRDLHRVKFSSGGCCIRCGRKVA